MKRLSIRSVIAVLALSLTGTFALGQNRYSLEDVLAGMVRAGAEFETLEARVERDTVNFLVNDHDLNAGKVYFQARGDESKVRLSLTEPEIARQDVLVADGKWQSYNPRTNQLSEGRLGARADLAQYLVVGFGPANAALADNFEIEFVGEEKLDGTQTSVLELEPLSEEVRNNVSRVRLWVDQETWLPVQQRLDQPSRNYQVVKYSEIDINGGVSDSTFELDLPDDVEIIRY